MLKKLIQWLATTRLPIPGKGRLLEKLRELHAKRLRALNALSILQKEYQGPALQDIMDLARDAEQELRETILGQEGEEERGMEGISAGWAILAILAVGGVATALYAVDRNARKWEKVYTTIFTDPRIPDTVKQRVATGMMERGMSGIGIWMAVILLALGIYLSQKAGGHK